MIEFVVILIAVAVVMATRWENSSRQQLGFGGVLASALGLRIASLVTAAYVVPLFSSGLAADEPASDPVKQEVAASEPSSDSSFDSKPAELEDKSRPEVAESAAPTPDSPAADAGQKVQPATPVESAGKLTDTPDSPAADAGQKAQPVTPVESAEKLTESRPAVAFITNVKYLTPNRPAWLESGPTYDNDGALVEVAIRAGPYPSVRDCEPDLQRDIQAAVSEFINDHLRAKHASTFFDYELQDLRARKIVRERFSEQLETSLGLMNQVHVKLAFDDSFRDELDQRWSEIKSQSRLAQTGLGAGIIILFLGTLFSFLKLDTATKGYYTGRLQFGAAATILALVAASVLLAKLIPWM